MKRILSGGFQRASVALAVLALVGIAFANVAQAVLIAYEPFNYATGSTVLGRNGGTGFTGAWATPRPGGSGGTPANSNVVNAGSLAGPAGLPTIGNHAFFTGEFGTMDGLHRPFTNIAGTDGTTTWISFLAQRQGPVQDPPLVGTNMYPRGANLSFFDTDGVAETPGTPDERVGVGNSSNAVDNEWSIIPEGDGNLREGPASHMPNWTTLAWGVLRIDHVGDHTVGDSAWLWVNPDPLGGEPLKANADVTIISGDANASDLSNIDFLRPFVGANAGTAGMSNFRPFSAMVVDEIRVGTTWDDMRAIPEPVSAVLLLVGIAAVCGRRNKRS